MLILITWGKELHLSNKRFIAVYGFCIKNMRQQEMNFQNTFMRVRQYKRFDYRFGHEKISTTILTLLLIQEGQLSVTGERMCTKYW